MKSTTVIGLTGGIGSGKTTVAHYFKALGAPIIDSDIIAREIVYKGTPALQQISDHFGATILTDQGELDRTQLRKRVFDNPAERQWLEALLHPLIRDAMQRQINEASVLDPAIKPRGDRLKQPYVIVVIPLLLESTKRFPVDRKLVVDAPETLQYQRASQRDQHASDSIAAIMATQVSRGQRLKEADDVIDNSGSLVELEKQVQTLDTKYRGLK